MQTLEPARTRYIWVLVALVAMQIGQPYLAYATLPARVVSSALLFGVGFAVFLAALTSARQRYVAARTCISGRPAGCDALRAAWGGAGCRLEHLSRLDCRVLRVCCGTDSAAAVPQASSRNRRRRRRVCRLHDDYGSWGSLYALVELLVPASFSINQEIAWELQEWHTRRALFDYFSFATISGVGYNDITTIAPTSNTLKWLEVMTGQFYLAVVVATTVGLKLAQALGSGKVERK